VLCGWKTGGAGDEGSDEEMTEGGERDNDEDGVRRTMTGTRGHGYDEGGDDARGQPSRTRGRAGGE
jgi:hypothetical protein